MATPESSSYDLIRILGLTARGRHGVYPQERESGQQFRVDITMYVDTRQAATNDDLQHTVDYSQVAQRVTHILSGPPVNLIETLAQKVADVVLEFAAVAKVEVEIHKPNAPMNLEFSDVTMVITRTRCEHETTEATTAPVLAKKSISTRPTATTTAVSQHESAAPAAAAPAVAGSALSTASMSKASEPNASATNAATVTPLKKTPVPPKRRHQRTTRPERNRAVLALGANLGPAAHTLAKAVKELDSSDDIKVTAVSGLFRSAPLLAPEQEPQPDYYNAVAEIETVLSDTELLAAIHWIEEQFGRQRQEHWGARTLDIDIIVYNQVDRTDTHLTLPHPRAHQRAFVLLPWLQIDPQAQLRGKSVRMLAQTVADQDVQALDESWVEDAAADAHWQPRPSAPAPTKPRTPSSTVKPVPATSGKETAKRTPPSGASKTKLETSSVLEPAQALGRAQTTADTNDSFPVVAPKALPTWQTGESRLKTAANGRPTEASKLRRPTWQQALRTTTPRIVDEETDLSVPIKAPRTSTPEATNEGETIDLDTSPERVRTPASAPKLDPNLPAGIAKGPLPLNENEVTISRETVMRPTSTGLIPVTKRAPRKRDAK